MNKRLYTCTFELIYQLLDNKSINIIRYVKQHTLVDKNHEYGIHN